MSTEIIWAIGYVWSTLTIGHLYAMVFLALAVGCAFRNGKHHTARIIIKNMIKGDFIKIVDGDVITISEVIRRDRAKRS